MSKSIHEFSFVIANKLSHTHKCTTQKVNQHETTHSIIKSKKVEKSMNNVSLMNINTGNFSIIRRRMAAEYITTNFSPSTK